MQIVHIHDLRVVNQQLAQSAAKLSTRFQMRYPNCLDEWTDSIKVEVPARMTISNGKSVDEHYVIK